LVDISYTEPSIIGDLDYTPGGEGDFVGQTGDKVNVNIDGTWYEDIDLSAVTGLAGLYAPINAATGGNNAYTSSAQLKIQSRTSTINSYVAIAEGTNTTQPVLARMGYGTGIVKSNRYGLGKKSIDINNRRLVSPSGGYPVEWSDDQVVKFTPNGTYPEIYMGAGVGFSNSCLITANANDSENDIISQASFGTSNDVGFACFGSFTTGGALKMGFGPNSTDGVFGNLFTVEDTGTTMRIAGYDNNSQAALPLEVILTSPDDTQWILTVDDSGNLSAVSLN
jgi:hypothetical protein